MAWIDAADIEEQWLLSVDLLPEQVITERVIAQAENVIRSEFPTIDEKILSGRPTLETVKRIMVQIVTARLSNPEGLRSLQDASGPFSGSKMFGGENPGHIYLTDVQRRDLRGGKRRTWGMTSMVPRTVR